MEPKLTASVYQTNSSRLVLKQQQNQINMIPQEDQTLIGKNSRYVPPDSSKRQLFFPSNLQKSSALSINNSLLQNSTIARQNQLSQSRYPIVSNVPFSLSNSCYRSSQVGSRLKTKSPIRPQQQLVVVNNLTFISYKQSSRSNSKENLKIISLKSSKSKQKRGLFTRQKSQTKIIYQESIIKQSNNINMSTLVTPPSVVRRQNPPQKIIQNMDQQHLLRKLRIFQNRVAQLHNDKQRQQFKLLQTIKSLNKQLDDKNGKIADLQNKLMSLCTKYEEKQRQAIQLQQQLWRQKQQNSKSKVSSGETGKVEMSTTTQNFINLTLSQQIENLNAENNQLRQKISVLQSKQLQMRNASLNKRWQNIINKPQQIDLPTFQDNTQGQGQITQVVPTGWNKYFKQDSHMTQNQPILQISRDQIMSIDSQHMQVDQIIHHITKMQQQNEKLKQQLKDKNNEIEIKDIVAMETAKIIQSIRDVVEEPNAKNMDGLDMDSARIWMGKIKQILAQFQ